MHAAGWGGAGTVVKKGLNTFGDISMACRTYALDLSPPEPAALSRSQPLTQHVRSAPVGLELLAQSLVRLHDLVGDRSIPRALDDLKQLGIDQAVRDRLAALVIGDVTEEMVVGALLATIEAFVKQEGGSRQLVRALRNHLTLGPDYAQLRDVVALIVAGPVAVEGSGP
jgi:hypothetical protein